MAVKVAINGFGRIGRLVLRALVESGREDVEVIALGVERGDVPLGSLPPVVAMVVVGAEVGDLVLAEHPNEPAGDRGLSGPGVADDAEHHRARHQWTPRMGRKEYGRGA